MIVHLNFIIKHFKIGPLMTQTTTVIVVKVLTVTPRSLELLYQH